MKKICAKTAKLHAFEIATISRDDINASKWIVIGFNTVAAFAITPRKCNGSSSNLHSSLVIYISVWPASFKSIRYETTELFPVELPMVPNVA